MQIIQKLVVFYQTEEINIKDIDREIYTEDKKLFHMFFFHNIEMDIDRLYIQKTSIIKEFEKVEPEIEYNEDTKTVTMIKQLADFDSKKLDKLVDENYKRFTDSMNYRISCILDTYKLFNKLYKDKTVIFLIPFRIKDKFIKLLEESKTKYREIQDIDKAIKYYDINYWANYFSRVFNESDKKVSIERENLVKILEILE
jgi:hypothetical protein